jgi:hypothetical protein
MRDNGGYKECNITQYKVYIKSMNTRCGERKEKKKYRFHEKRKKDILSIICTT